jgi:hypothetical protein
MHPKRWPLKNPKVKPVVKSKKSYKTDPKQVCIQIPKTLKQFKKVKKQTQKRSPKSWPTKNPKVKPVVKSKKVIKQTP